MTINPGIDIDAALRDGNLLGAALGTPDTWSSWMVVLRAAFGLPLAPQQREIFDVVAGGRAPPTQRVRELWAIAGRRGGKSRIAAAVAAFVAAFVDHADKLAAGEQGFVLVLAPTQAQAAVTFGYLRAFFERSPILAQQIESVTASEVRLAGNVVVGVHPNSFRTIRSRTLLACVFDECAYWRDETSANPDLETYRAVLPALATTSGMLIGIGSPYRRVGLLHAKHRDYFGRDDADVLVVKAGTELFNPRIDRSVIARAREDDPIAALSEWDAEFRSDLSALLDDATVDAAIDRGRPLELPPRTGIEYRCFVDASAGRHDAFCVCVAHGEGERVVADVVRGRKPPFDPAEVVKEFAAVAREYRCSRVVGDAFAGEWVSAAFRSAGVNYERSELPKSGLYLEGLPYFNRGVVSVPDLPILVRELRLLERRVHRSGRDTCDHNAGGSDDYANVVFGALHLTVSPTSSYDGSLEWVNGPDNDEGNRTWQMSRLWNHILN